MSERLEWWRVQKPVDAAPTPIDPRATEFQITGVMVYLSTILSLTPQKHREAMRAEFVEVGYVGPQLHLEIERGEFEYVRYGCMYECFGQDGEYEVCEPGDVKLVGRSYANWLVEMGVASVISEEDAIEEGAFQRHIQGKEFDPVWARERAALELASGYIDRAKAILVRCRLCDNEADLQNFLSLSDWSSTLDALGGPPRVHDRPSPASQSNEWSVGRICLGGPLHGEVQSIDFHSFHPPDYDDMEVFDGDGVLFMRAWAHRSLTTDAERNGKFIEWFSSLSPPLSRSAA